MIQAFRLNLILVLFNIANRFADSLEIGHGVLQDQLVGPGHGNHFTKWPHHLFDFRSDILRHQTGKGKYNRHHFGVTPAIQLIKVDSRENRWVDLFVRGNQSERSFAANKVKFLRFAVCKQGFVDDVNHFGNGVKLSGGALKSEGS